MRRLREEGIYRARIRRPGRPTRAEPHPFRCVTSRRYVGYLETRSSGALTEEAHQELERAEIGLVSLTESLDTTTPGGMLTFYVFGAIAQFERALIRERTTAELAEARQRGRKRRSSTRHAPERYCRRACHDEGRLSAGSQYCTAYGRFCGTLYHHIGKKDSAVQNPSSNLQRERRTLMADRRKRPPGEALVDIRRRLSLLPSRDPGGVEIVARAADAYGVSIWTLYRALRELNRPKRSGVPTTTAGLSIRRMLFSEPTVETAWPTLQPVGRLSPSSVGRTAGA